MAKTANQAAVKIIRAIVRGQLRHFVHHHPDVFDPKWISSIEKRIMGRCISVITETARQA
jgi:hypothetical protein